MLQKLNLQDFKQVYDIMEASFPKDEHRPYNEQKALLDIKEYQIYVEKEDKRIKGFLAVWEFDEVCFIEHFAVNSAYRNKGLGAKMIKELCNQIPKRVCLEVELPDTEMARRRIGFYERNNFYYNAYSYMQPSISIGRNPIPLRIMTTNGKITEEEFLEIKELLYRRVYKC
ncbi:MAG: GNAT family N-acetyltransferase [Lachnospiraceae bacterium]|nr:GNAT family N-acetyltransferase [Lachnospiraceae bacterium]